MMEDGRKRKAMYDIAGESSEKRARSPAISDDGDEDIMAWLSVDEETMGELMELLDEEVMTSPAAVKVKFIDNPYSSPVIFQSSSSYVTINGNEESCGSSFSDSDSSVMASIDVGCVVINNRRGEGGGGGGDSEAISGLPASENGSASGEDDEVARYFVVEEEEEEEEEDGEGSVSEINGSDCFDWDDALLARFLGEDHLI